jgi:tetratricopeptide (TPR) repeat protein
VLDSIYAGQPSASSTELKRWADDPDPSLRKTLAGYYLARFEARLGRLDRSQKLLENVVSENSSAVEGAALDLAALRLSQGHPEEVLHLLPETGDSAQGRFLRGLAFAALNEPDRASALFVSAASDPTLAETALYNAAVCDLLAGKKSTVGLDLLKERFPSSPKIRGLALRKGYELARQKDASAPSVFGKLAASDDRGLSSLATLALAEWEYQNGDPASARRDLLRISTNGSTEPQADALAVFLTDDGRSDDAAIAAARKYLESHPGADAEPEVMMKLGEILFRKGDFAGARVQFESLAKKHPGTALEFPALFLAAQSASRLQTASALDDAMLLFEEVASSKSPLALRARFEQAVLQNVLGKPNEAIILLDKVISSPGPSDLQPAARMEKGKTLYSQGSTDPKFYTSAIGVWKQIADDPATTPAWRNQALSRIGTAYENLGDPDSALAAYYDVLKDEKLAPESYFWFYKAGFAAARLLEATNRWEQAIKVYEMIAAAGGPRSEEATSRINKIRLENFLWDAPGS